MTTYNKNRLAPESPIENEQSLKEFLVYLADKYMNGHLLPDFAGDPPNAGGQYRMYFNTMLNRPRYYNGSAWVTI